MASLSDFFRDRCDFYRGKKCQECGAILVGSTFEVAHILAKSNHPEVAQENLNILGLCKDCHARFDSSMRNRSTMKVFPLSYQRVLEIEHLLKKSSGELRFYKNFNWE